MSDSDFTPVPKTAGQSKTIWTFATAGITSLVALILHWTGVNVLDAGALGASYTGLITSVVAIVLRFATSSPVVPGGGSRPGFAMVSVLPVMAFVAVVALFAGTQPACGPIPTHGQKAINDGVHIVGQGAFCSLQCIRSPTPGPCVADCWVGAGMAAINKAVADYIPLIRNAVDAGTVSLDPVLLGQPTPVGFLAAVAPTPTPPDACTIVGEGVDGELYPTRCER